MTYRQSPLYKFKKEVLDCEVVHGKSTSPHFPCTTTSYIYTLSCGHKVTHTAMNKGHNPLQCKRILCEYCAGEENYAI
jgi:hypothetical protein